MSAGRLFAAVSLVLVVGLASAPTSRAAQNDGVLAYVREGVPRFGLPDVLVVRANRTDRVIFRSSSIRELTWSPDGSALAFVDRGVLRLWNRVANNLARIPGTGNNPVFARDGGTVFFASDRLREFECPRATGTSGSTQHARRVFAHELSTGKTRLLGPVRPDPLVHQVPRAILADGRLLVAAAIPKPGEYSCNVNRVLSMSSDGESVLPLPASLLRGVVSPSGERIARFENGAVGAGRIVTTRIDGSDARAYRVPPRTYSSRDTEGIGWSPDETAVSFIGDYGGGADLCVLALGTARTFRVTNTAMYEENWSPGSTAWGAAAGRMSLADRPCASRVERRLLGVSIAPRASRATPVKLLMRGRGTVILRLEIQRRGYLFGPLCYPVGQAPGSDPNEVSGKPCVTWSQAATHRRVITGSANVTLRAIAGKSRLAPGRYALSVEDTTTLKVRRLIFQLR